MPKRPSQTDLNKVAEKARVASKELAGLYADGRIAETEFVGRFETLLANRYSQAVTLGRKRGGSFGMDEAADRAFGQGVAAEQQPYIHGFADGIAAGNYNREDGSTDVDKVSRRMDLYIKKIPAVANEAMALASDPETIIKWVMGAAEHCGDCVSLANGGPYRADSLPTTPCAGDTSCLMHCKCKLEREDRLSTFGPV
jgi:hypothetical protein